MLLVMLAHAQAATPAQECPKPTTELKLNSIIAGLFLEQNMPAGSIIDVGALDGAFACFYARVAPDRIIHALDPFPSNVESFRRRYAITFPNIHPMVAALGEARSVVSLGRLAKVQANGAFTQLSDIHLAKAAQKPTAASPEAATVPIYAADDLFKTKWSGERLGFAHIDVEGSVCGCKSHSEPIAFMLPILTFPVPSRCLRSSLPCVACELRFSPTGPSSRWKSMCTSSQSLQGTSSGSSIRWASTRI